MIKNFVKLFRNKQEEERQRRAEESRKKETDEEINEATARIISLVEELKRKKSG